MDKIKVEKLIPFFKEEILEGDINNVLEKLNDFKTLAEEYGYEKISLSKHTNYDYAEIECHGFIIEDDKEYLERIKKIEAEENKKIQKEKKERETYEKLKAKFG